MSLYCRLRRWKEFHDIQYADQDMMMVMVFGKALSIEVEAKSGEK